MYHDSPGRLFGETLMLSVGFPLGRVFLPRDEFPDLQGWLPELERVSGKGPGAPTVTVFILPLHLPAVQALASLPTLPQARWSLSGALWSPCFSLRVNALFSAEVRG